MRRKREGPNLYFLQTEGDIKSPFYNRLNGEIKSIIWWVIAIHPSLNFLLSIPNLKKININVFILKIFNNVIFIF